MVLERFLTCDCKYQCILTSICCLGAFAFCISAYLHFFAYQPCYYIFQVYNLYLEDNHSEEVIHVTQMVAYTEDTVHSLSLNPILIV